MKPRKSDFLEERVTLKLSKNALDRSTHGGRLPSGIEIYNTEDFKNQHEYKAVGLTYEIYDDGSRGLCWMVYNDENVLTIKAVQEFEKVG